MIKTCKVFFLQEFYVEKVATFMDNERRNRTHLLTVCEAYAYTNIQYALTT